MGTRLAGEQRHPHALLLVMSATGHHRGRDRHIRLRLFESIAVVAPYVPYEARLAPL